MQGSFTNLEITEYGNAIGIDWERNSLNMVRRKIAVEGLSDDQVREKIEIASEPSRKIQKGVVNAEDLQSL